MRGAAPMHSTPLPTDRSQLIARLQESPEFDLLVIGGGATGLSVALDAACRGHRVALLEAHDFAEGSSSRATKLLHGGVRYLAQGNLALVREALRERSAMLRNAPHLASPLAFVMPSYHFGAQSFHHLGLWLYDALAGAASLGKAQGLSRLQALEALPILRTAGLKGGVRFWDGQFDDARLALAIARTAAEHGALLINRMKVDGLLSEAGRVCGVHCIDSMSGQRHTLKAGCVVNATGVWVDEMRAIDGRMAQRETRAILSPSQGVHLVLDPEWLSGEHALLVPKTSDGRVLFAVPWLGKVVLGTTDTARKDLSLEPRPLRAEIDFLLAEASRYFTRPPQRSDVRSAWVGLRPLVDAAGEGAHPSRSISREHTVMVSPSALVSVTGGKWTTCRAMAEDVIACCEQAGLLEARAAGATRSLPLVGGRGEAPHPIALSQPPGLHLYGDEASHVQALEGADQMLVPGLSEAMVRFAIRHEYALTVADVLSRRSRLLFLDARSAHELAPRVASIIQTELGCDPQLESFRSLARQYLDLP